MKRILISAALFGAASLALNAAHADSVDILIVTPTRTPLPADRIVADTTVITAADIRRSQAPDLPSVLRQLAGVEISQSGGVGQPASLFMRGTNSDHVLILVDGVRMDSATTGTTALSQLMLDQIDHIEVVRGNASSLYGSSAIGGVIQIFTKHGKGKPALRASAGVGSHNARRASAGYGGQAGNTGFDVQVSRYITDGVSAINPALLPGANPDKDGYRNTSVSARLSQKLDANNKLSAAFFQSHADVQFDNAFNANVGDSNSSVINLNKFSVASENRLSDMWLSKLQWAQGTDDAKTYLNGQPDPNGYLYRTENRQITWQNTLTLNAGSTLVLGAQRLRQQVSSTTLYTRDQRTDNAFFAGYDARFGPHAIQVSVRQDRYSDFGRANSGSIGYGYSLNTSWRATISHATAFKAPNFNDLYYPLNFGYQGNPNLQPERSHNSEAGLHYDHDGQRVDVVYFYDSISNLIAINGAYTTVININRARIRGGELMYAGQFGDTGVHAALTTQSARNAVTDQPLLRRASLYGNLGVTRQLGAWQLAVDWRHSGTREDRYTYPPTFASYNATLASYNVIDLSADYTLAKEWKLRLSARNLTNQNDSGIYGYNPMGRVLFASVDYRQ